MPLLPPPRLLLLLPLPAPCDRLRSTCFAHSAALLLLLPPPWRSLLLLLLRWLWRSRLLLPPPPDSLSSTPASCLTIFAMAPSRALIHSTISVSAEEHRSSMVQKQQQQRQHQQQLSNMYVWLLHDLCNGAL
jgi:hypothetical protein